jgi:hypothetical protein
MGHASMKQLGDALDELIGTVSDAMASLTDSLLKTKVILRRKGDAGLLLC